MSTLSMPNGDAFRGESHVIPDSKWALVVPVGERERDLVVAEARSRDVLLAYRRSLPAYLARVIWVRRPDGTLAGGYQVSRYFK